MARYLPRPAAATATTRSSSCWAFCTTSRPARARAALWRALAERLSADGVLIVTFWRFGEDARIRGRTLPWPPAFASQVEPNDFLLPWGDVAAGAVRYCHHFDEAEERELVAASGLTLTHSFAADGTSGALNAYRILRR